MKPHILLISVLAVLGGCSKSSEPAGPAAAPASAPAEAPPAPAPKLYAQLAPEQVARLQRPDSPVSGPANARVTLVEFLDPACEACRAFAPVVKQVQFLYPDDVRVVSRFADFHPGSDQAIRILLAAHRQKKFETVMAAMFEGQEAWASHHSPSIDAAWKIAAAAGLDMARARKDAASEASSERLNQEMEDLMALKVSRTPTFYVNGKLLTEFGPDKLMQLVAEEVKTAGSPSPH